MQSGGQPQELTAGSETLVEGLEHTATVLDGLARGSAGPVSRAQADLLQKVVQALQRLRSLPVAILPEEEAQHFVNVPGLVDETVEELRSEAEQKGLELRTERPGPIPLIPTDRSRLRQVIEGLIAASIRRTEGGHVTIRTQLLSVRAGRPDKRVSVPPKLKLPDGMWAVVSVTDTSPGLSDDTQYALSAPKADPEAGKTGPGLSMGEIRMIAESLGGFVWHESREEGPAITFVVPAF